MLDKLRDILEKTAEWLLDKIPKVPVPVPVPVDRGGQRPGPRRIS